MTVHIGKWYIYIVEACNGIIKIGVSERPENRASSCSLHSPIPVRLIAAWRAPWREEGRLHKKFDHHRLHNEWFRVEGDLALWLETKRGLGVPEIMDWSLIDGNSSRAKRKEISKQRRSAALKRAWARPGYRERRAKEMAEYKSRRELQSAVTQ